MIIIGVQLLPQPPVHEHVLLAAGAICCILVRAGSSVTECVPVADQGLLSVFSIK